MKPPSKHSRKGLVPKDKSNTMKDVAEYVRENIRKNYTPTELFDPADDNPTFANVQELRTWAQTGYATARNHADKVRQSSNTTADLLDAVAMRYRGIDNAAASGGLVAGQQAIVEFNEWKKDLGNEAWAAFQNKQGPIASQANEVVTEQARIKAVAVSSQKATDAVVKARNALAGGQTAQIGTVVVGLVDGDGNTFLGTSGKPNELNPVMRALLDRVTKAEEWDVDVCGEVDAMNQYLNANPLIISINRIPVGITVHAETFQASDDASMRGKWKGRGACGNCRQWLKIIKAN